MILNSLKKELLIYNYRYVTVLNISDSGLIKSTKFSHGDLSLDSSECESKVI